MMTVAAVTTKSAPTSFGGWLRRAATIVIVAAIVCACFWAGGFFPSAWFNRLTDHNAASNKSPTAFSSATVAAPPIPTHPVGNDTSVSKVPLPLILVGTMPGRNAREGLAFIGVDKNSPQTYQAGALLVNNARIAEIYTDHVVLERDHHRVELYLEGRGDHKSDARLASMLTVGGTEPPPPAKITSHEVLTDYIRPSPVYDGEILRGYKVYPGQEAGVFAQLGLEPGDVITAIDGVPLNEPQTAVNQLHQITDGVSVMVNVERSGKTIIVSLDGGLVIKNQHAQQNESIAPSMPPL